MEASKAGRWIGSIVLPLENMENVNKLVNFLLLFDATFPKIFKFFGMLTPFLPHDDRATFMMDGMITCEVSLRKKHEE